jgi:hypothetical protein
MLFAVSLIVFLFSGALLALMIQDVEIHKRMLRRYMRRLDKEGDLGTPIGWWTMKFTPFVLPAWFFNVPGPEDRPDLYSRPELVEIIEKIKRNQLVIKWILVVFLPSAVIVALRIMSIVTGEDPPAN